MMVSGCVEPLKDAVFGPGPYAFREPDWVPEYVAEKRWRVLCHALSVLPRLRRALHGYDDGHVPSDPDLDLAEIARREIGGSSPKHFWSVRFWYGRAEWTLFSNAGGRLTGAPKIILLAESIQTDPARPKYMYTVITPWCFRSSYRRPDLDALLASLD